jgi:hypothetical protein
MLAMDQLAGLQRLINKVKQSSKDGSVVLMKPEHPSTQSSQPQLEKYDVSSENPNPDKTIVQEMMPAAKPKANDTPSSTIQANETTTWRSRRIAGQEPLPQPTQTQGLKIHLDTQDQGPQSSANVIPPDPDSQEQDTQSSNVILPASDAQDTQSSANIIPPDLPPQTQQSKLQETQEQLEVNIPQVDMPIHIPYHVEEVTQTTKDVLVNVIQDTLTSLGISQNEIQEDSIVHIATVVKDSEKILKALELPTELPNIIPMQEDLDRHDTPLEKSLNQMTIQQLNYYIYRLNKILPLDDQIEADEYPYFYTQLQAYTEPQASTELQASMVEMPNINLDQKQTNLKQSKLMKGPDKAAWIVAEDLQIEQYERVKMYKKPIHRSQIERNASILRSIWIYAIKANGRFKARNVTDGEILLRIPKLKERLGDTFSASMSQTEFCLFIALSVYFNYIIWGADATNAFSHAGPPKN